MGNQLITIFRNDSDPKVSYQLADAKTGDNINLHSTFIETWLKMAMQNSTVSIFLVKGEKVNGGFDGQTQYRYVDPNTGLSLLTNFDPGRYQGELFITTDTYFSAVSAVNGLDSPLAEQGVFTAPDHGLATGEKIFFTGVTELSIIGNAEWTVTVIDNTTFTLQETFTIPETQTTFASAVFYNITTQETLVLRSPYNIKGDFQP